jgi:hypothetical protein
MAIGEYFRAVYVPEEVAELLGITRDEVIRRCESGEMQISPAWTLTPTGPMGTYVWQAELASILAWKGVRLDG